ncbi:Reverse transcriptase (RNA-dependent DNA polymerase) [Nesidiocoris tenuis]|nr:Reverse transcriptase (RNA-dependent DNA polymerase) [Nesidiocoris tenuis]
MLDGSNLVATRESLDEKVNHRGLLLEEVLQEFGLIICNGRAKSDCPAAFTFTSSRGKSVIDLAAVNLVGAELFEDLYIKDDVHISDHYPAVVSLKLWAQHEPNNPGNSISSQKVAQKRYFCSDEGKMASFQAEAAKRMISFKENRGSANDGFIKFVAEIESVGRGAGLVGDNFSLRRLERHHKPWFNGRCRSLRYQVRNLYRKLRRKGYPKGLFQDYSELKSKYVRVLRQAKREFFDRHQCAINDCKNAREFWKIVKTTKKKPYCENPVPLREWEAFYKGIYKPKPPGSVWPTTLQLVTGLDEVITLQELEKVLCRIKNGKAPGEDAIPNDVLKILPKNWKQYLVDLFNHILAAGEVPVGWGRVKLYLLHKKGDQTDPSNYRGIALMSTIVKVFTTILADRLTSWANVRGVLPEEQAGFRAKRSCTDHIFTLHAAACLCLMKKRQPLVTVMVDLKRAFDSVCHDKLWSKLEKIGVSGRIIRVLVSLYSSACFLIQPDPQGERFEQDITEGVLQGDCLSPLLFILFLSDLGPFMDERGCHGLRIGGKELSQLIFADDLVVLADSVPDAQRKVNILQEYCRENSLSINVEKSKVLIFRGGGRAKKMKSIYCENVALEVVPSFQYLGVLFSRTGKFKQNKDLYISKARRALGCTKELFYKGKITSWESRSRLFQSMVESVLLYASEVWGIWYMDDLEIVQSTFIKSTLCLPRSTPGHFLRVETGSLPVKAKIFRRTVHYWQKILNMERDRWPRLCYEELLKAVDDSSTYSSLNWVRRLRDSLLPIGMGWLLNDPERVQTKDLIKAYENHCTSSDIARVCESGYGFYFRNLADFTERQWYLGSKKNLQIERIIAQMRTTSKNEIRFYAKGSAHKISCETVCNVCNTSEVEDHFHFMLRCPLYNYYRNFYLSRYINVGEAPEISYCSLLDIGRDSDKLMAVYHYISQALRLRAFSLEE